MKNKEPIQEGRWFRMTKAERISLLCQEFGLTEEAVNEIYSDDPNELPKYMIQYFQA
jgi:hypothetical protein